jgi:hypothetical protein
VLAGRGLDKRVMASLSTCDWIRHAQRSDYRGNGLRQDLLACALGQQACRQGFSVLYVRLSRKSRANFFAEIFRRLSRLTVRPAANPGTGNSGRAATWEDRPLPALRKGQLPGSLANGRGGSLGPSGAQAFARFSRQRLLLSDDASDTLHRQARLLRQLGHHPSSGRPFDIAGTKAVEELMKGSASHLASVVCVWPS